MDAKRISFSPQEAKLVNDMVGMNNDLVAIYKQREQYEKAVEELKNKVNDINKGNFRNKNVYEIYGNRFLFPMKDAKDLRKVLLKQKDAFEQSVKALTDQIQMREDMYIEYLFKVRDFLEIKMKDHGFTEEEIKGFKKTGELSEIPSALKEKKKDG